ncbi:peroxidase P7 [Trifolium repens]|nr:peroxidase P7 [Trifolium repens]
MYSLANGLVNKGIISTIKKETRIGASLLRLQLHFHDCFVNVVMHQFCWMIQAVSYEKKQQQLTIIQLEDPM